LDLVNFISKFISYKLKLFFLNL